MNILIGCQVTGQGEDILEWHHKNNGHPSAPDPALLAHPSQTTTASKVRAPRNSKKLKDVLPSPNNLGFYHATWKDCLEDAKKECRAAHASDNLFPSKAHDLNSSITESLVTVVVEWTKWGTAFEPGMSSPCHARTLLTPLRFLAGTQKKYGNHSKSPIYDSLLANFLSFSFSMIFPHGAQSWRRLPLPLLRHCSTLFPPMVPHLENEPCGLRMLHQASWNNWSSCRTVLMKMCISFSYLCYTNLCQHRGKRTTSLIQLWKKPWLSSFTQAAITLLTSIPIFFTILFPCHA